jgi:hypothetical protein
MRSHSALSVFVFAVVCAAHPAAAQLPQTHSGDILTAAQYDLYVVNVNKGDILQATLVCDEIAPNDRPLDPVLSVYFPGSDSSDTVNADVYNDDGFGSDDDPNGVDCNAFDSSRVTFVSPVTAAITFRADGFGSATGPYTLNIVRLPFTVEIPTLDVVGLTLLMLALAGFALYRLRS